MFPLLHTATQQWQVLVMMATVAKHALLWQHWDIGMQAAAEQYIYRVQSGVAADPHGQPGAFKMGFHSIPSMSQLHMHVISQVLPTYLYCLSLLGCEILPCFAHFVVWHAVASI